MKKTTHFLMLTAFSASNLYASENDLYEFLWLDPDKQVYVLQNKLYPKHRSFYFDVGYLMGLSNEFQDTNGIQLKAGYYFHEEWAIELQYRQYSNSDNNAYKNLQEINQVEPFVRRFKNDQSLFVIWSPFYGKINTFNKIFYFDWSFGLGVGKTNSENNLESVTNTTAVSSYDAEDLTTYSLKTNVKFHLNENLHLGVEFINSNFQAESPQKKKKWEMNNDIIFTIGVSF